MEKTENLIKYYLLEKGYNSGHYKEKMSEIDYMEEQYEKYLKDEDSLSDSEFLIWANRKVRETYDFGSFLRKSELLKSDDKVIEIIPCVQLSCTSLQVFSTNPPMNVTFVHSLPGEIGIKKQIEKPPFGTKIVSSSMYADNEDYMLESFKEDNPIVMGFVGYGQSSFNKRRLEYFKTLKKELQHLCGQKVSTISGHNVYVLHYGCSPKDGYHLADYTLKRSDR